jgi:hypothetical protein
VPHFVIHRPSFNDELTIKAKVTEDVDVILYFVMAKGLLLEASRVYLEEGDREAEIYITPDFRYAPSAVIYAYYYKKDIYSFMSTSLGITFKKELPNHVSDATLTRILRFNLILFNSST